MYEFACCTLFYFDRVKSAALLYRMSCIRSEVFQFFPELNGTLEIYRRCVQMCIHTVARSRASSRLGTFFLGIFYETFFDMTLLSPGLCQGDVFLACIERSKSISYLTAHGRESSAVAATGGHLARFPHDVVALTEVNVQDRED